jgi:hypothetical protein
MRAAHGSDQISVVVARRRRSYHRRMHSHIATEDTRTLTVVLPESDWRALRQAEPDAVGWIQQQIRSRLSSRASSAPIELADEDY